jgi:7-cyano-7-deazaguanine synthase
MTSVLVLHSGGLDSTVCMLQALEAAHSVTSLGIRYGQRHEIELRYARSQCERLGVERTEISVEWVKPKRDRPLNRGLDEIRLGPTSSAFLPGRNLVFLALASAHAAGVGAAEVWTGVNHRDSSGYPDCTPEFVDAFRQACRHSHTGTVEIRAPLQDLTKPEIAAEAERLGLRPGETWSCYSPTGANGDLPCGACDACVLHAFAWAGLDGGT